MYEPRWDIRGRPETPEFIKGKKGEQRVRDMLNKLLTDDIEVKTDKYYMGSRRWLIEYRQVSDAGKWVPSGICTTQAGTWFFVAMYHNVTFSVDIAHLWRAFKLAAKDRKCWFDGSHLKRPTKGIFVTHEHFFLAAQDELK